MDRFTLKRPHFFFSTAMLPCPYLPNRLERKIVTELNGREAVDLHESLSSVGFRRSHSIAYTPACPGCRACVPVRIVVNDFIYDKAMRRVWRKNGDLSGKLVPARSTIEQYRLFSKYQDCRHEGGDMAMMGLYDYRSMIEDTPIDTLLMEFRDRSFLLRGAALIDRVNDGLSAVYSFYDPDLLQRSLGSFIILSLIEEAKRQELPYVYLGYWIKESDKMSYKTRFHPLEAFGPGGWKALTEEDAAPC